MSDITETLLEMHFHRAIVKCFEETFGAKFLRLLKPSTTKEAWVGFDQGWSHTSLSNDTLFEQLKQTIADGGEHVEHFYLGYFMQFKSVRRMARLSKYSPQSFLAPYYRAELSLAVNDNTGLSQHQTLLRLSAISGADVSYVCPLMFSIDELYDEPNLDQLQIVDVRSAPTGWSADERHFVAFQDLTGASAQWCSEPVPARSLSFRAWAESLAARPIQRSGPELLDMINAVQRAMPPSGLARDGRLVAPTPFTVVQFAGRRPM